MRVLGAVVVPFDGFHLANSTLAGQGKSHRKGALDTFDTAGYPALLERLRDPGPTRLDRLVGRHVRHGKTADDAGDWALGTDQVNAELVAGSRDAADLCIRLNQSHGAAGGRVVRSRASVPGRAGP